jgi:DNA (cytosine-5)-methyltransferase 1
MKVLSLYTGAGGFDLGLEEAGFKIAGCVENDADARATIDTSTSWPLIDTPTASPGDIHLLRPEDILERFGLAPRGVALLAGGPPCQPFSKASLWVEGSTQRMLDPRARTLHAYFNVLEAALPDAMLLENVQGITYAPRTEKKREEALDVLNAQLEKINARHRTSYAAQLLTVDAADYGVPQRRERVFIFASREGDRIQMPPPTHAADPRGKQLRLATCWDAIGDLADEEFDEPLDPTGRWAALLATIPEGHNYQWHTPRGGGEPLFGWRTKYWSFLLKLAKSRPAWTIQALPGPATGPFHWKNRKLSVREMTRLQTIPDTHAITGSYLAARRQIGNAVPAAIGELLGLEIRRQLYGQRVRRSLALIPDLRDDCPPPEQIGPIPSRFLVLRGEHAAHRGTGQGPEALRRRRRAELAAQVEEHAEGQAA